MKHSAWAAAAVIGFTAGCVFRSLWPPESKSIASAEPIRELFQAPLIEQAPTQHPNDAVRAAVEVDPIRDSPVQTSASSPSVLDALTILDQALSAQIDPEAAFKTFDSMPTKYSGLSLDQMRVAELALQGRIGIERHRISSELFDQGRFESHVVPDGETIQYPRAAPGEMFCSFGFRIEPGDGYRTIQYARIPLDEYPEFRGMQQESWWLGSYLRQQEKQ